MPITEFQEATIRRLKAESGLDSKAYHTLLSEDFGVTTARDLTPGLAEYLILTLRILLAAGQNMQAMPSGTQVRWQCLICGHMLKEEVVKIRETDDAADTSFQHCGHPVFPHFLLESERNSEKIPY